MQIPTDPTQRKKLSKRVSRLKSKQKAGKPLAPAESELVAAWAAAKKNTGRPSKQPSEAPPLSPTGPKDFSGTQQSAAPPDATTAKKPPTSGNASEASSTSRESNDSTKPGAGPEPKREKSQRTPPGPPPPVWGQKSGDDKKAERRAVVTQGADLITVFLLKANNRIRENGSRPVIPDELIGGHIRDCWVDTLDDVLPDDFEVSKKATAAACSSVIVGQDLWTSYKKKKTDDEIGVPKTDGDKKRAAAVQRNLTIVPARPTPPKNDAKLQTPPTPPETEGPIEPDRPKANANEPREEGPVL